MSISAAEISGILKSQIENFGVDAEVSDVIGADHREDARREGPVGHHAIGVQWSAQCEVTIPLVQHGRAHGEEAVHPARRDVEPVTDLECIRIDNRDRLHATHPEQSVLEFFEQLMA